MYWVLYYYYYSFSVEIFSLEDKVYRIYAYREYGVYGVCIIRVLVMCSVGVKDFLVVYSSDYRINFFYVSVYIVCLLSVG